MEIEIPSGFYITLIFLLVAGAFVGDVVEDITKKKYGGFSKWGVVGAVVSFGIAIIIPLLLILSAVRA